MKKLLLLMLSSLLLFSLVACEKSQNESSTSEEDTTIESTTEESSLEVETSHNKHLDEAWHLKATDDPDAYIPFNGDFEVNTDGYTEYEYNNGEDIITIKLPDNYVYFNSYYHGDAPQSSLTAKLIETIEDNTRYGEIRLVINRATYCYSDNYDYVGKIELDNFSDTNSYEYLTYNIYEIDVNESIININIYFQDGGRKYLNCNYNLEYFKEHEAEIYSIISSIKIIKEDDDLGFKRKDIILD